MKHHIIVKWNEQVKDKKSLIPEIKKVFEPILNIEGIHSFELIENIIDRPNRYDLMIRIDMEENSLPIYDACEAHHEWKEKYSTLIEKKAIFDCENTTK